MQAAWSGTAAAYVAQATLQPGVRLLTVADEPALAAMPRDRERLRRLFADLKAHAEYVLVDTVPVTATADASAAAAEADGVILVVDLERTRRRELAAATRQLANARAEIVGIVVNRSTLDHRRIPHPRTAPARWPVSSPTARWRRCGASRPAGSRRSSAATSRGSDGAAMATAALAVVIGDIDLVRTLGLAGITSVFAGAADALRPLLPPRAGRAAVGRRPGRRSVATLLAFARTQPEPPVLYPQTDAALLLAAHHRDELGRAFRFALADTALIDELVDKDRFQALAERRGCPSPRAHRLEINGRTRPPGLDVAFPLVVKPVIRTRDWTAVAAGGKALHVRGPGRVGRAVAAAGRRGARTSSCSSWCRARDRAGELPRLRRRGRGDRRGVHRAQDPHVPALHGYSTAVEIVELPDVAALGRDVLARLGLRGRRQGRLQARRARPAPSPRGQPAVQSLASPGRGRRASTCPRSSTPTSPGRRDRPAGRATRRVTWCTPLTDLRAAHATGMSALRWMRWARRCDVMSSLSRDDPLPFVRGTLWSAVRRRVPVGRNAD